MIDKVILSVYILQLIEEKFFHLLWKILFTHYFIYGVINMLKNKIITHSLYTMFMIAAPLAVAVTPGHAWDVKSVDYETHLNKTDLIDGSYLETGGWVTYSWPCANGAYRYLSSLVGNRIGMALWLVEIPKTGWYKMETSFRASENRTTEANYAVYVNTSTADAISRTGTPVDETSFSQRGEGTSSATIGQYCLQPGDISMLVLDGDDGQSDSADATTWTFVGTQIATPTGTATCTSQGASQGINMTPVNHLLLKSVPN